MSEPLSLDQSAFMTTFSGRRVNALAPKESDIRIEDIAHALGNLCRFTGHCKAFYSVAQHSVLVSLHVPRGFALEGLLHDASETYINDLSRPVKHHPLMVAYTHIEAELERVIRLRFGLPATASPEIKRVDNMLVCDEAIALMTEHGWALGHERLGITFEDLWSPEQAQQAFVARFHEVTAALSDRG